MLDAGLGQHKARRGRIRAVRDREAIRLRHGFGETWPEHFDAATELWFDSVEDFTDRERLYDSPEGATAVEKDGELLMASVIFVGGQLPLSLQPLSFVSRR